MEIIINGKKENLNARTIADIVKLRELEQNGLVIEHNGNIVKQEEWHASQIQAGDKLELLSFVGGG